MAHKTMSAFRLCIPVIALAFMACGGGNKAKDDGGGGDAKSPGTTQPATGGSGAATGGTGGNAQPTPPITKVDAGKAVDSGKVTVKDSGGAADVAVAAEGGTDAAKAMDAAGVECTPTNLSACPAGTGGMEACCTGEGKCSASSTATGGLCDNPIITTDCEPCARKNCPDETKACDDDPGCKAVNACIMGCDQLMSCATCLLGGQMASLTTYQNVVMCAVNACPNECVALGNLTGTGGTGGSGGGGTGGA